MKYSKSEILNYYYKTYVEGELSLEEREQFKKFLELIENTDIKELQEYLDSEIDIMDEYCKKEEAIDMIQGFLSGQYDDLDEIEDKITDVYSNGSTTNPNDLFHQLDYEYEESLYRFMLHCNHEGRTDLFNKKSVATILNKKVEEKVNNILDSGNVSKDLYSALLRVNNIKNEYKYMDYNLLDELYKYENSICIADNLKLSDLKMKEVKDLKEAISKNKKDSNIKRLKVALGAVIISIPIGIAAFIGSKAANFVNSTSIYAISKIDGDTKKETKGYNVLTNLISDKCGKYRYVAVVGDDLDHDFVNVEVYDYTNEKIKDKELKTIELNEDYCVYNWRVKISDVEESLLTEYTGEAHRDIANVDVKINHNYLYYSSFITAALLVISIEMVIIGFLMDNAIRFNSDDLIKDFLMTSIHDLKYNRGNRKKLVEKYKKLNEEIKKLKRKEKEEPTSDINDELQQFKKEKVLELKRTN